MFQIQSASIRRSFIAILSVATLIVCSAVSAGAHPLGNFTINRFARIAVGNDLIEIRYVIDMAEIPAFQELQAIDSDGDRLSSGEELNAYAERISAQYADAILLTVEGVRIPLKVRSKSVSLPPGSGGLRSLRLDCDLMGAIPAGTQGVARLLRFEDKNYSDRIGWREIFATPISGTAVFNSSCFGNGVTDELRAYPDDMLSAPLDEREAELSFVKGSAPEGAFALLTRDGRPASYGSRDRLAELISVEHLSAGTALLGLLFAVLLGGLHALSPGHGKTIVGTYLVGTRGTARHAAFLGLTVTVTHTAGVFALGLVATLASNYIVPEQLYPILSFVSGALVVAIGLSLLIRRIRAVRTVRTHGYGADHSHSHPDHEHRHDHVEGHSDHSSSAHSHFGRMHSHLPPGADDSDVTWRSLLALGISGGILPCPSALVVLLAAISLHRVGYGLLLVVAFSLGLAGMLTGVGLVFVYARGFIKPEGRFGRVAKALPIVSALIISCAGAGICYEALGQSGFNLSGFLAQVAAQLNALFSSGEPAFASASVISVLGLGFIFGLKHATEADHIVAVSAIVSEHRKLSRAALVGGLWGAGHTASLVVVGTLVLVLRVVIPQGVASWLEFGVALMIIGLGAGALRKALRGRSDFHIHRHDHEKLAHAHIHFHEQAAQPHSHAITQIGFKPALIGAMHGLAGSAALTLLVLTQIDSYVLGLIYLFVFGAGSIMGMLLMSSLVGLPFALSARRLTGVHFALQMLAGVTSVAFGIWYALQTGITGQ